MNNRFGFSTFKQRPYLRWVYSFDRRIWVTLGAAALVFLVVGFFLGNAFGYQLLGRGTPVTISNIPGINRLIEKVNRHFAVNTGENPSVATVQDPSTLKQQNPLFYREVEAGDRLLVWPDRALLYSTKQDKILAAIVAPNVQAPWAGALSDQPPNQSSASQTLSFEIRNGSSRAGAAQVLANRLKDNGLKVIEIKDAQKKYNETLIVPLSEAAKKASLESLLPLIGGRAGDLPAGERGSSADILVIVGTDQS